VLPRRLGAYNPTWLDQLTTSGEMVWIGAGPLGRSGKVALYYREDVRLAGPPPANAKLELPKGDVHDAIRERLALAPSFWLDLVAELGAEREELHSALWDLVWAGEVTNDAFAPLRARRLTAVGRDKRPARRFASRRSPAQEAIVGRWSLTETLFRNAPAQGPRTRAQAELMLVRYGIDTRETVLADGYPAASRASTASSRTSRCSEPLAAAISSRALAAPNLRSQVPWSAYAGSRTAMVIT